MGLPYKKSPKNALSNYKNFSIVLLTQMPTIVVLSCTAKAYLVDTM